MFYIYAGHPLIESIYYGRSIEPLNKITYGQELYPLEYYLETGNALFTQFVFYLTLSFLSILGFYGIIKTGNLKSFLWSLLIAAIFFEGCILALFKYPALNDKLPSIIRKPVQNLAIYERVAIQYNSQCFQLDPELIYIFKPGICTYGSYEFVNEYRINHLGLRDDEESLDQPEIIILGDSTAMGLGIHQEETYAQVLERISGMKTLNAGISSYGTVREIKLFNRIGLDTLKYLIIHYNTNDNAENYFYYHSQGQLPSRHKFYFSHLEKVGADGNKYYPGRYFIGSIKMLLHHTNRALAKLFKASPTHRNINADNSAKYFFHVLDHEMKIDLNNVTTLVITDVLTSPHSHRSELAREFEEEIDQGHYPAWIKNSVIVDINTFKCPNCYYHLDDHPTAVWHNQIAHHLWDIIQKLEQPPQPQS